MDHNDLRDHMALQDVMLNYAAAVDLRDIERYKACFTDDVEVVGFGTQTYHGLDAWVDYVWGALKQYSATQHLLGSLSAHFEDGEAHTRCDVQALHFLADGDTRFTVWATYNTTMRQVENHWKISRHELTVCGSSTD